jgi:hypothetical protein
MCELAKVYNEDRILARKEHTCCECRLPIKKGEAHYKCSGLWDEWQTFRQHVHCYHFARSMNHGSRFPNGCEMCHIPFRGYSSPFRDWNGDMDPLVLFNKQLNTREYECSPDECIPFGGVREYLTECDGDEEIRFWNAMISGISEEFLKGEGI